MLQNCRSIIKVSVARLCLNITNCKAKDFSENYSCFLDRFAAMTSLGEFEVLSKNGISGSLTLVIKRKQKRNKSKYDCGLSEENKENFLQKLREEEMRFQNGSIASFYERPAVSYKTLIQMAFAELSEEGHNEGLQAHEIAQWMCRKWVLLAYFMSINWLLKLTSAVHHRSWYSYTIRSFHLRILCWWVTLIIKKSSRGEQESTSEEICQFYRIRNGTWVNFFVLNSSGSG